MLINIAISCELDRNSGRSECSLLLAALLEYRETISQDPVCYGPNLYPLLTQLDTVVELVNKAMLQALEGLEEVVLPDGNNGYKTVYELRTTSEGGRAE